MKALTGLPADAYLKVAEEAEIQLAALLRLVQALENGAPPAYLARYRSDLCGGLDARAVRNVQSRLRAFLDLADRKVSIMAALERRGALTAALRERLEKTLDRRDLEDIYLPWRPKKRDGADEAFDKGLEPLARFLWSQNPAADIDAEAARFVNAENGAEDAAAALAGAYAIAARWLGEKPEIRRELRKLFLRDGEIAVSAAPGEKAPKDRSLIGYRAKASKISWRRMLAIRREARGGGLNYALEPPAEAARQYLVSCLLVEKQSPYAAHIERIAATALRSQAMAGLREEVLQNVEDNSEAEAVRSFENALRKMLLAPPARGLTIVGLETGRPGGWRAAVVTPDGEIAAHALVRSEQTAPDLAASAPENAAANAAENETAPEPPQPDAPQDPPAAADAAPAEDANTDAAPAAEDAAAQPDPAAPAENETAEKEPAAAEIAAAAPAAALVAPPPPAPNAAPPPKQRRAATPQASLADLLTAHNVDLAVFPNGPALRETERFLRAQIRQSGRTQTAWQPTAAGGAWIYANSKTAKREMPQYEPAVRSAACLARRVQDPLCEMAKVDPRTLGIGPGHHEVEPRKLREALQAALESCVHEVGADLNRAPRELLALVPGLTERLAKRIVEYRAANGPLTSRADCRKVQGLNDRIYRQAAGFLRAQGGNPLDDTGVHPSCYPLVKRLAAAAEADIETILADPAPLEKLNLEDFADNDNPLPRLQSLVRELHPRRRDPRGVFNLPRPAVALRADEELQVGAKVEGTVSNVTDFGAFIDIGGDHDGLLHVSQIADELMRDSKPRIEAGDRVPVFITALERNGKRISLSMRGPRPERRQPRAAAERARGAAANGAPRRRRPSKQQERGGKKAVVRQFGPDEKTPEPEVAGMSLEDKLLLLKDKYRTKT